MVATLRHRTRNQFTCASAGIGQPPGTAPDGPKYLLRAVGCAFNTRVARVVGTTSEGARATAVPVNGF
ncbi:MAG: hypothetical protein Q8P50_13260 [Bacillota bacterium]|nr:hypothetical protein [Bacillota bacterium]